MKSLMRIKPIVIIAALVAGCFLPSAGFSAGLLKPVNGPAGQVHIQSHQVNVTLNNGFARTEVDQVFINTGDRDLEGTYSFPLPKQASLSEVSLWIDGKEVIGEVLERKQAETVYQQEQRQGRQAALATKNDYKTFEVRVAAVRAGQQTRVRLVYYQPLEIDLNIGRYIYPLEEGHVDEQQMAFWAVDDQVRGRFGFHLTLKSAYPVKDVRMPGYQDKAVIQKADADSSGGGSVYEADLSFGEGGRLSRDVVFYYRLEDSAPARVELIPYREKPEDTGTFMVVVTPGGALQPISRGTDWTFVLDVSGSMSGTKIATLADGVGRVIGQMASPDRFRIVTFNSSARDITGGYRDATPAHIQKALTQVKAIQAGGSTALHAGLEMAYRKMDADRPTGIILVTDGVANVGPSTYADLMKLHRKHDVRLFTMVIGNSANQPLLDGLAKSSGGFAMNLSTSDDVIGRILQARTKLGYQALYDAKLKFSGEQVTDLTPAKVGNLHAGQQLVLFGRFSGQGPVQVTLSGKIDGRPARWTCRAQLPATDTDNPEIERLWALSRIEDVMTRIRDEGETDARRQAVIDLGTGYSLVTDYTAMVVLSDQAAENHPIQRHNAQRVARERQAQTRRAAAPVKNYRVDTPSPGQNGQNNHSGSMFGGARARGIGSGPVGPLFIGWAWLLRRRKRQR